MALAQTSLSIAANSISELLEQNLSDVHVVVDAPAVTMKMADSTTDKHFLNLFFYRVAPSAVHAAQTTTDPIFLRIFALVTPFAKKNTENGEDYPNLRILGEVIRYFHENPVGPALQTPQGSNSTQYAIQAVLQAPNMEELNHIWTTQGSDLSYQLSAAYEFALVPIDPLTSRVPDRDVTTAILQVDPHLRRRDEKPVSYDLEFSSHPLIEEGDSYAGPPKLPTVMVLTAGGVAETAMLKKTDTEQAFALVGAPDSKAQITLHFLDKDSEHLESVDSLHQVSAVRHDDPAAKVTVGFRVPDGAQSAVVEVRPTDKDGALIVPERVGNTLILQIVSAP